MRWRSWSGWKQDALISSDLPQALLKAFPIRVVDETIHEQFLDPSDLATGVFAKGPAEMCVHLSQTQESFLAVQIPQKFDDLLSSPWQKSPRGGREGNKTY
jgi:hypothetical protein